MVKPERAAFLRYACLLIAVAFGRAVGFPFLDWDDHHYILANPLIQRPLFVGVKQLLLTPHMGYPQPVTVLSQHVDYLVGKGSPWPFHSLSAISEANPDRRPVLLGEFYSRHVHGDTQARAALSEYRSDTRLGPVASALLEMH